MTDIEIVWVPAKQLKGIQTGNMSRMLYCVLWQSGIPPK